MRPGEEEAVRKLLMHAPVAVEAPKYTDPRTKANALLQASGGFHFPFFCEGLHIADGAGCWLCTDAGHGS